MKKISIFILLAYSVLLLCSCAETDTEYSIESFDAESRIEIEVEPAVSAPEEADASKEESHAEPVNATFLIKDKTYTYRDHDVVLLDITNEAQQNLSITITMTYYDESGAEIKSEERFFEQFAAGYQNYFLFKPDLRFDDYTYTIHAVAFDGEVIIDRYEYVFVGLKENRSLARLDENGNMLSNPENLYFPTIESQITFGTTHTETMYVGAEMLLFNEKDELVHVKTFGYKINPKQEIGKEYKNGFVYQTEEETLVWPEQYTGEIRAVFCYTETLAPEEIVP